MWNEGSLELQDDIAESRKKLIALKEKQDKLAKELNDKLDFLQYRLDKMKEKIYE